MFKHNCIKCGNNWLPRVEHLPKNCPRCKSPTWMEEKRPKLLRQEKAGYFEKYGFSSILPGGQKFFPFIVGDDDRRENLARSASQYIRRHGWKASIQPMSGNGQFGIMITRQA